MRLTPLLAIVDLSVAAGLLATLADRPKNAMAVRVTAGVLGCSGSALVWLLIH